MPVCSRGLLGRWRECESPFALSHSSSLCLPSPSCHIPRPPLSRQFVARIGFRALRINQQVASASWAAPGGSQPLCSRRGHPRYTAACRPRRRRGLISNPRGGLVWETQLQNIPTVAKLAYRLLSIRRLDGLYNFSVRMTITHKTSKMTELGHCCCCCFPHASPPVPWRTSLGLLERCS